MTITRFSTGAIRDNALATNTSFAASDMELIGTVRVGSGGVSSVTFSNIPQEYKHLQIRGIASYTFGSATMDYLYLRLNGDTGTNYSQHGLWGNGSTAGSFGNATQAYASCGYTRLTNSAESIFGGNVIDILDYSNSSKFKTIRGLAGADANGTGTVTLVSSSWRNTSSVDSISLVYPSQSARQFTKFALYGIRG